MPTNWLDTHASPKVISNECWSKFTESEKKLFSSIRKVNCRKYSIKPSKNTKENIDFMLRESRLSTSQKRLISNINRFGVKRLGNQSNFISYLIPSNISSKFTHKKVFKKAKVTPSKSKALKSIYNSRVSKSSTKTRKNSAGKIHSKPDNYKFKKQAISRDVSNYKK